MQMPSIAQSSLVLHGIVPGQGSGAQPAAPSPQPPAPAADVVPVLAEIEVVLVVPPREEVEDSTTVLPPQAAASEKAFTPPKGISDLRSMMTESGGQRPVGDFTTLEESGSLDLCGACFAEVRKRLDVPPGTSRGAARV
jgi:hypothetical protein